MDQRRFDNQSSGFLSSREAAKRLGVKLTTLYAYTSRGLLRSVPGEGKTRARLYSARDVERLRARSDARAGHRAVAAGALRWGEPVLDSAITEISPRSGPSYRGHRATDLVDTPFESVAELLWTGELNHTIWPRARARALRERSHAGLSARLAELALADRERHTMADTAELERARAIIMKLAGPQGATVAERFARGAGIRASKPACAAINRALVLSADHELNVSTFAARVTASSGADLYACMTAGMAALSGSLHGGGSKRVEALLDECRRHTPGMLIRKRAARGDEIPGFGHPLYPGGDPRVPPLVAIAGKGKRVAPVIELVQAMRRAKREPPTLDVGLVAVARSLALPRGSAAMLFAIGRMAGWVAHVLEQRIAAFMLRPRARYISRSEND